VQDLSSETGLLGYSWTNKGVETAFEFSPNDAAGVSASGTLIVDPIDFGSTDDYGSVMQSDFEWKIVGDPVLTFGGGAAAQQQSAADQPATEPAA
jgi:hypothetical protein